jgi:phage baseplate assembly protein W
VALENISRYFKDVSLSFKSHPITNDILTLTNVTSINRSLRNLVLTLNGERPFNSLLGTQLSASLFEILDTRITSSIESEIKNVISNFEPRIEINTINVTPDFDQDLYDVLVDYNVIGATIPSQQLNFVLQTVR